MAPIFGAFFPWHPAISQIASTLWAILAHYRHHFPGSVAELLGSAAIFIAKPRAKDMRRVKDILEHNIMVLTIENTNICNANCRFCAHKYMKRPKQIMSDEMFKHSVSQFAAAGGRILNLTPIVGDPLVDNRLIDKIRFAKELKSISYVTLFTNLIGSLCFNAEDILSSGLSEINVSTCIGDKDMYGRIFGVDKYDRVMENLDNLLRTNLRHGNKVKVMIHVRGDKPYKKITSSGDYKHLRQLYGRTICHIDTEFDNWNCRIKEKDLPKGHKFRKLRNMLEPCSELYYGMIIFVNGDVGICWRRDLEADLVIGNIYEHSLEQIWRGEKLQKIREEWVKGNIPGICRRCGCYTSLTRLATYNRSTILSMEQN